MLFNFEERGKKVGLAVLVFAVVGMLFISIAYIYTKNHSRKVAASLLDKQNNNSSNPTIALKSKKESAALIVRCMSWIRSVLSA